MSHDLFFFNCEQNVWNFIGNIRDLDKKSLDFNQYGGVWS